MYDKLTVLCSGETIEFVISYDLAIPRPIAHL